MRLIGQVKTTQAADLWARPVNPSIGSVAMVDPPPDIDGFRNWALGNLVDNTTRGLVRGVAGRQGARRHRRRRYSGRVGFGRPAVTGISRSRSRPRGSARVGIVRNRSTPNFRIPPRKMAWDAATDEWESFDPPRRVADVYVFCLHQAVPATNENVGDPAFWTFWVIPTERLDDRLGAQKTVRVTTLDSLTAPLRWYELRDVVDRCRR